jgi:PAS domain S-box-containing protein
MRHDRIGQRKPLMNASLREEFGDKAYQQLFHHSAAIMLLIDPANGRIVDSNEAAIRFYGYPRARLLQLRIWELNQLPEADVRRAMQSISDKVGQRFEFTHRLADGSVRQVEVFSCVLNASERKLLHSIVSDITERKQMEAALRASEERYRAVLEDQTEVISRIKWSGEITFVNEVFCRFFRKTSHSCPTGLRFWCGKKRVGLRV